MVNKFLMTQKTGEWFCGRNGVPEVHCEIIAGRYQSFDDFAIDCGGLFISIESSGSELCRCWRWRREFAGMIKGTCAEHVISGKSEVIDPVSV